MSRELRLIQRAADGDDHAYETWLGALRPRLVRYASDRLGGDRSEAEDVVQDAAMRALLALRDGRVPANPRAWMFVIVRNRCHDVRSARRPADALQDVPDLCCARPGPDEVVAGRCQLDAVVDAIGSLPDNQRRALIGATLEGRPYEELAAREDTSVQAIKSLVHRARRGLEASGARAAAFVPGILVSRLRGVLVALDGPREQLAGLVAQHTAAAASVAALAVAAVPVATVTPGLHRHGEAGAATVADASAPAPRRTPVTAPATAASAAPEVILRACRGGASLAAYDAAQLARARQHVDASDEEYGDSCGARLDAAMLRAG